MGDFLKNFSLEGKVAWITGASYGLGLAYAVAYAESGAKIVFNDINQDLVDKGLAEYEKRGIKAFGKVCDVTKEDQVQEFVAAVEKEVGTIDILVNNAGIIKRIPMHEMTVQEWNQVIDVDLTGPFICSKAVLPAMMKKGSGKIINACSMMSEFGRETVSAYAAAKGGSSYKVVDEIKKCVEFKEHNLLKDPYPSDCDMIVCRNVVIYFTDEAKDEIYKKFYKSLKKGGYLFIGSTEQIMNYKEMGYLRHSSFFFEK